MAQLKLLCLLLLLLVALPERSSAQQAAVTRREGTIAQAPVCSAANRGSTYSTTDSLSGTDCTVGGGALINFCVCDGSAYVDYAAGGSVGGAGTLTTIKENNLQIGGTNIIALDFLGVDFNCSESPLSEINCAIAPAIARTSDLVAANISYSPTPPMTAITVQEAITEVTTLATSEPVESTHYQSTTLLSNGLVTSSDVLFLAIHGYNSGPVQYFHLYNLASVPADGAIPKLTFKIEAASNFYFDLVGRAIRFTNGISWSNSLNLGTKLSGAADIWIVGIEYR